jgi:long-subunit fatty acid transport protein
MLKKIAFISIILLLTGCESSPEYNARMARLDNPEVHSEAFKFRTSIGSDGTHEISLDRSRKLGSGRAARIDTAMTLGKGFEAKYVYNGFEKLSLKYQFYGAGRESASAGNWSHAVSLGYGEGKDDGYLYDDNYSWYQKVKFLDLALISGYRFNDSIQVYGGFFYQPGELDLEFYQYNRSKTAGCESYYNYEEPPRECFINQHDLNGENYGFNLAVELKVFSNLYLTLEAVHGLASWYGIDNAETTANFNFAFYY